MITQEQLKDCAERRDALRRYLDIDNRRIELEEEELRTHVPDFWEHPKEAQAQMKKIKDIQGWITGFEEVDKAVEELTLGFDFIKEGLIEEPELDALAADAISKIERLELRNMLRREEDRMDVVLALEAIQDPVSLFEPVCSDGSDALCIVDQVKDERVRDEDWVQDIAISDAMGHLNEREKKILRMRFFEGRTQMEVAGEIGISQAQVSRLEKHALMNMRKHLGE